ncbi:MAG: aromatic amino acid transport family protein [Candidatus Nealsonbacteria bacterium]
MKFLRALSVFAGTIIGVGIFGLPYVASKAGFFVVVLYFLFLSVIAIAIHLIYGKIALGTTTIRRLPGYAGEYLGPKWKKFAFLMMGLGIIGALLAYLVVGGEFLSSFLSPYFGGNSLIYTLLFFGLGSFLIFRGIKNISQIELVLLVVFFIILFIFFTKTFSFIDINYLKNIDLKFLTLPYGVILFALWGSTTIPEVKEILEGDAKLLKRVIISGVLLAALTYLFFIFIVFGASGQDTSKEAISGLSLVLGDGVIRLGFIFGIITCFTSFLTLGLALKRVFMYDFGLKPNLSWLIACFLPLLLFFLGVREFIEIISLTGSLAIGCMGITIIFTYKKFLKRKFSRKMNPAVYILLLVFLLGVFSEIFYCIFAK